MLALLLLLTPAAEAPFVPPDTDAESARVCPDDCKRKADACARAVDWWQEMLVLNRHTRWSDRAYYNSVLYQIEYARWERDVYVEAWQFSAREDGSGHATEGGRVPGSAAKLYRLIGPEMWKAGKAGFPPVPKVGDVPEGKP